MESVKSAGEKHQPQKTQKLYNTLVYLKFKFELLTSALKFL
ncbi:hypothetical protein SAMN05421594_0407 [Chryseobacterium oleae]|uniref:Uncharacterized protein n=1 Tax=Chryseobacterium oleae TaxID=491207 RepID=A0A1I4VLF6_CHROL|nr:hypothetical protein SAMN05421594_0407 [Chryseobacterium oleae]